MINHVTYLTNLELIPLNLYEFVWVCIRIIDSFYGFSLCGQDKAVKPGMGVLLSTLRMGQNGNIFEKK